MLADKMQIPDKYKGPKWYYGMSHSGLTHGRTEEEALNHVNQEIAEFTAKGYNVICEHDWDYEGDFVRVIEI